LNFSYNNDKTKVAFAGRSDINASYKDLSMVCESIRYKPIPYALKVLNGVINEGEPIRYRRYNKHMGSRHELGGNKGRYPKKCALIVKNLLSSAVSNAINKGFDETKLVVMHASANKNMIAMRYPSKGNLSWGRGMYGRGSMRRSDLEFAKLELGVADPTEFKLSDKASDLIKLFKKQSDKMGLSEEKSFTTKKKPSKKVEKDKGKDKNKDKTTEVENKLDKKDEQLKADESIKSINPKSIKPIKNVNVGNDRY